MDPQIFILKLQLRFHVAKSSNKRKWKILSDFLLLFHCHHNWSWKEITSIRVRRWMPMSILIFVSFPSSTVHNVRWKSRLLARSGRFGIQKSFGENDTLAGSWNDSIAGDLLWFLWTELGNVLTAPNHEMKSAKAANFKNSSTNQFSWDFVRCYRCAECFIVWANSLQACSRLAVHNKFDAAFDELRCKFAAAVINRPKSSLEFLEEFQKSSWAS